MRRQPWGLYAIAGAILVIGLIAFGVPPNTLLLGAFVLVCPLMMMFMMGGMHGDTPTPSSTPGHPNITARIRTPSSGGSPSER
jgi:hypothetical protein